MKGHPELAGKGIEYSWGKGKYEFRNKINQKQTAVEAMREKILRALGSAGYTDRRGVQQKPPLPLERVRKFAREARAYRNAYAAFLTPKALLRAARAREKGNAFKEIEKMVKLAKTHRCTFDQEMKFCIDEAEA